LESFTDNIPNGFIQQVYATTKTVTANGNAKIDTSQSEFGGASGSFDGTNSYLSTPDSSDWNFGTGDFTIDFWVRFNSLATQEFWGRYIAGVGEFDFFLAAGPKLQFYADNSGVVKASYVMTNPWGVSTGQWHHIALVRSGSNVYIFIDGVSQTLTANTPISTNSLDDINTPQLIGEIAGIRYLNGWLDEFRVSKGIARWTSNFTPPSAPYSNPDSNTILLLHMNGTNGSTLFTDDSATITGPDFSIGASPGSQSIGAGGSALSTLTLTALGGFSDQVDLVITSGCSATGMTCTLNGSPTYSVPGGSGTVPLAVNTQVNTPPAAYPVVVTGTDHVNGAITHQATFTVTVGPATSYQFNVKGTATQIVVTLTYSWTGSGTPPQGSVTISSPSGVCSPSCLEAAGVVYDRTSIAVSNAGNTYSIIHRVTFTITAPGAMPAWTAYVTLSGVSTYTVTIEVS
jgi:hypothetical protein